MSEVVDHLAELTGFRDRDVLDVTLVGAFRDLLRPDMVTIYRPVGEAGNLRWLRRHQRLCTLLLRLSLAKEGVHVPVPW